MTKLLKYTFAFIAIGWCLAGMLYFYPTIHYWAFRAGLTIDMEVGGSSVTMTDGWYPFEHSTKGFIRHIVPLSANDDWPTLVANKARGADISDQMTFTKIDFDATRNTKTTVVKSTLLYTWGLLELIEAAEPNHSDVNGQVWGYVRQHQLLINADKLENFSEIVGIREKGDASLRNEVSR